MIGRRSRPAQPRRFEERPSSPCIKVCRMVGAGEHEYCLGCRRTRDEIARWWTMSSDEQQELVRQLADRKIRD